MSRNSSRHPSAFTKHVKKKTRKETTHRSGDRFPSTCKPTSSASQPLEPRRDLPLHKIPELLAKITGTCSSSIASEETKLAVSLPTSSSSSSDVDRCRQLFRQYTDDELMSLDGLLRFCSDLSLEPDCYEILLFCFLCRARHMYSLTFEEFLLGLQTLGHSLHTLLDIRAALIDYRVSAEENQFYAWTYHYGLIDGQRCLSTANAVSLWRLFYSKDIPAPEILDRWLTYLEHDVEHDTPKTITCDTWIIFPQFGKFIQSNGYDTYDDNEAWPCLFDSFVESQQKLRSSSE